MIYQVNHQFRQAVCRSLVFNKRQALGEFDEVIRHSPLLMDALCEKRSDLWQMQKMRPYSAIRPTSYADYNPTENILAVFGDF